MTKYRYVPTKGFNIIPEKKIKRNFQTRQTMKLAQLGLGPDSTKSEQMLLDIYTLLHYKQQ